jgi:hypothetical protein
MALAAKFGVRNVGGGVGEEEWVTAFVLEYVLSAECVRHVSGGLGTVTVFGGTETHIVGVGPVKA